MVDQIFPSPDPRLPPPTTAPVPVKPGWQTTEFYGMWAVKILGALMASGVLGDGTTASRVAGAAIALLGFLGYTYSRAVIKAAAALLLVGLLAGPQVACSASTRQREATGIGGLLSC